MKHFYKIFLILLFTGVVAGFFLFHQIRIGNVNVGLSFPCACLSSKDLVQMQMYQINETLNYYYKENEEYPHYDKLIAILNSKNGSQITSVHDGRQISSQKQGVYYTVSKDLRRYDLQGYALANIGKLSFVVNVESDFPDTSYQFQ